MKLFWSDVYEASEHAEVCYASSLASPFVFFDLHLVLSKCSRDRYVCRILADQVLVERVLPLSVLRLAVIGSRLGLTAGRRFKIGLC